MDRPSPKLDLQALDAAFRIPLLRFFKRRIGDPCEAEDLTQQVFLRLITATPAEVERPDAYIFTVASNLLRDRKRRAPGPAPVPIEYVAEELAREWAEDRSPERVLVGRETLADVLAALDELGERTRAIYILFRLENMKQADIAALYGIGRSTVEKHVMRATLHLALRFGRS